MKKTVQEIKNHEVVKYHQKPSSDNEIIGSSNLIRMEKKNTFKTYNEFVRMVINEENKEKMLEEPNNLVLSIAQKEKLDQKEK